MDYKTPWAIIAIFFSSTVVFAELRDPTKPANYASDIITDHQQADDLRLSSIWISKTSRRATINGVVARQGDIIFSDIKIIKIYNNTVKIEQNGTTRKLTLLTRSYKTK